MSELKPGEIGWAPITYRDRNTGAVASKDRAVMVLELAGTDVVVAWGTGTPRDEPRVMVEPRTQPGMNWGVNKPTYFYEGNVRRIEGTSFKRRTAFGTVAPPAFIAELRSVVRH